MDPSTPQPVTQLLAQWRDGDERAFAQLSGIMYEELRQLAPPALGCAQQGIGIDDLGAGKADLRARPAAA